MSIYKKFSVIGLALTLIAVPALARGINDGTLPLKLNGTAQNLTPGSGNRLAATVNITSAHQDIDSRNSTVNCESRDNDLKYTARGTINVGTQVYAISGICANDRNDDVEVIGQNSTAPVRITGTLTQQAQTTQIDGRLKVGAVSQPQSRFSIHVSNPD